MSDDDPFKGMTVGDFNALHSSFMAKLGRALAPAINRKLAGFTDGTEAKPRTSKPSDYCPGCGEVSDRAPGLCAECADLNAT